VVATVAGQPLPIAPRGISAGVPGLTAGQPSRSCSALRPPEGLEWFQPRPGGDGSAQITPICMVADHRQVDLDGEQTGDQAGKDAERL